MAEAPNSPRTGASHDQDHAMRSPKSANTNRGPIRNQLRPPRDAHRPTDPRESESRIGKQPPPQKPRPSAASIPISPPPIAAAEPSETPPTPARNSSENRRIRERDRAMRSAESARKTDGSEAAAAAAAGASNNGRRCSNTEAREKRKSARGGGRRRRRQKDC
ncbi:hypothetical protein NL676_026866 [Syzygium grande]|nr:hypothetical protein NL676_026866 [Syzygium grande]